MAELKTKKTKASVREFLKSIKPKEKRADSLALLKLFEEITKEKGAMWGTAIVGFGSYHYESSKSAQKGDWPLTGFSPRKQNLTIYLMVGTKEYEELLAVLGKHKASGSCLYIKRLSDISIPVLKKIITRSVKEMKKKYKVR